MEEEEEDLEGWEWGASWGCKGHATSSNASRTARLLGGGGRVLPLRLLPALLCIAGMLCSLQAWKQAPPVSRLHLPLPPPCCVPQGSSNA